MLGLIGVDQRQRRTQGPARRSASAWGTVSSGAPCWKATEAAIGAAAAISPMAEVFGVSRNTSPTRPSAKRPTVSVQRRPACSKSTSSETRRSGRRSRSAIFVDAGEVAGFLFCLLLLLPHAIERRSIEHDLDGVVPAQSAVLGEDGANPFRQVLRNLDFVGLFVKLLLHLLEPLPQLLTAVEGAIWA